MSYKHRPRNARTRAYPYTVVVVVRQLSRVRRGKSFYFLTVYVSLSLGKSLRYSISDVGHTGFAHGRETTGQCATCTNRRKFEAVDAVITPLILYLHPAAIRRFTGACACTTNRYNIEYTAQGDCSQGPLRLHCHHCCATVEISVLPTAEVCKNNVIIFYNNET